MTQRNHPRWNVARKGRPGDPRHYLYLGKFFGGIHRHAVVAIASFSYVGTEGVKGANMTQRIALDTCGLYLVRMRLFEVCMRFVWHVQCESRSSEQMA